MPTLFDGGPACPVCLVQEQLILSKIQEYFEHNIPEVKFDDEDKFVEVLQQAGLTDG